MLMLVAAGDGPALGGKTGKSLSLSVSVGRPSLISSLRSSSASSPPRLPLTEPTSGLSRLPPSPPVRKVLEEVVE